MKYSRIALAAAMAALTAEIAVAQEEEAPAHFLGGNFSANIALTSDYRFRGISQTFGDPTVQGGVDWASDLFYLGIWASGVDFGDAVTDPFTGEEVVDGTTAEFDFYAGYTPSIGDVDLSFGVIYYLYPAAPQGEDDVFAPFDVFEGDELIFSEGDLVIDTLDQNYIEFNAGASYTIADFVDVSVSATYSPDYYLEAGNLLYVNGSVGFSLGTYQVDDRDFSIAFSGNAGHLQFFEDDVAAISGFEDYIEYSAGITFSYFGFDLDVRYVDTFGLAGNNDTGVVTLSRAF